MSAADAFEAAAGLLGALALIPVAILILVGAANIGNPGFDFISWFETVVYALVRASIPAIGLIFVVGLLSFAAGALLNSGR